MAGPDTLSYALGYAELRLQTHPQWGFDARQGCCGCCDPSCTSPGKHPKSRHGVKDATIDEDQLVDWFGRGEANIALAMGQELPDGTTLLGLDIDGRSGGLETLEKWETQHDGLDTLTQQTPGGGLHKLFRAPAGLPFKNTHIAPGAEIKHQGGSLTVAPSTHASGGQYAWLETPSLDKIKPAPQWLLNLCEQRGKAAKDEALPGTITHGRRNDLLFSYGRKFRYWGLEEPELAALLGAMNQERCRPLLDEEEVRRIAESAAKASRGKTPKHIEAYLPGTVTPLWGFDEPPARKWVVAGLIPEGFITVLAGHGGVGKSLVALYLATCLALGRSFFGRRVGPCKVLLVDFELNEEEQQRRLLAVLHGMVLDQYADDLQEQLYYYKPGVSALTEEVVEEVRVQIEERGIQFTILDSLTMATGGKDATSQREMVPVLRSIEAWGSTLVLDHTTKVEARGRVQDISIFGSVMKHNIARSTLKLKRDGSVYVLHPDKSNFGARAEQIHYLMEFEENHLVRFREANPKERSDALRDMTTHDQDLHALQMMHEKTGEPVTATQVQQWLVEEEIKKTVKTVRNNLSKLSTQGRLTLSPNSDGYLPVPETRVGDPGPDPDDPDQDEGGDRSAGTSAGNAFVAPTGGHPDPGTIGIGIRDGVSTHSPVCDPDLHPDDPDQDGYRDTASDPPVDVRAGGHPESRPLGDRDRDGDQEYVVGERLLLKDLEIRKYNVGTAYPVTVRYVTTEKGLREALAHLQGCEVLAADTETYPVSAPRGTKDEPGLDVHRNATRLVQLYGGTGSCFVVDIHTLERAGVNAFEVLAPLWKKPLVFHHAIFDAKQFMAARVQLRDVRCTGVLDRCTCPSDKDERSGKGRPLKSLKTLCEQYLGITLGKEQQLSDWAADELTDAQLRYAARDTVALYYLAKALFERLERDDLLLVAERANRSLPFCARAEFNGVTLDREAHRGIVETWEAEKAAHEETLYGLLGEINLRSPKQKPAAVEAYLVQQGMTGVLEAWKEYTLEHKRRSKPEGWQPSGPMPLSMDKRVVAKVGTKHPGLDLLGLLLAHNRLAQRLSSFGEKLLAKINPVTGRIHPSYIVARARSGRFAAERPNFQQMPRGAFRKIFTAREGHLFVGCDFGQIELLTAAVLSEDETMLQAFRDGVDLHALTAAALYGISVDDAKLDKARRSVGKAANFGLIYGQQPKGFCDYARGFGADLTLEEAGQISQAFFAQYSTLGRWIERVRQHTRSNNGRVRTRSGRLRRLPRGKIFTSAVNTSVQGTTGEIMQVAMHLLTERLEDVYPVATVHDEVLLECREEEARCVRQAVEAIMVEAFLTVFPGREDLTMRLAEAHVGRSWLEAKG